MTKKDYDVIAQSIYSSWYNLNTEVNVLSGQDERLTNIQLFTIVDIFCQNLRIENHDFNKDKFVSSILSDEQIKDYKSYKD